MNSFTNQDANLLNYEEYADLINRMKMNIELYLTKEFKELNKLYTLNIIKIKREMEAKIKNLNNAQKMELIEQIGYNIIYYEISEQESANKYEQKLNNCLIKYLSNLQNLIKNNILKNYKNYKN